MRYSFTTPPGWSRSPFPPPQRGVYLRAPTPTPSPEGASILLFDAVAAHGSLEDHLAEIVSEGCEGLKVVKQGKPVALKTTFPTLMVSITVTVPASQGTRARDEQRIFALVDAGSERLPVAFIGGAKSLPMYQGALESLLGSIGPLAVHAELYRRWVE